MDLSIPADNEIIEFLPKVKVSAAGESKNKYKKQHKMTKVMQEMVKIYSADNKKRKFEKIVSFNTKGRFHTENFLSPKIFVFPILDIKHGYLGSIADFTEPKSRRARKIEPTQSICRCATFIR